MADLKELRSEIDAIDEQILHFLAKRVKVCEAVGNAKKNNGLPIHDAKREEAVLKHVREKAEVSFGRFKIRLGSGYDPKRYPHLLVQKLNDRAAEQYVPEPYAGRVALIRSRGHFSGLDSPSLGWSECIKDLEIHELPVYPKGMLVEPFCGLLAETLKKCLLAG